MLRMLRVSVCLSVLLMSLPVAAQQAPLQTPSDLRPNVPAQLTVVRSASFGEALSSLGEVRRLPMSSLKANPVVKVGTTQASFRPLLDNPRSLTSLATRLRQMPALVDVREDALEAVEVRKGGLVVRSTLGYRLKPGACSGNGRDQLAKAGIRCFARLPVDPARAFADRNDPRYVADSKRRGEVLAARAGQEEKIRAQIQDGIASLRNGRGMTGPRTPVDPAELAEMARLKQMSDEELAGELANQAEVRIEELSYVPEGQVTASSGKAPSPVSSEKNDSPRSYALERFIFLTGFTLGEEYQWKQRIEMSINWCFFGCRQTYYVELFAGFSYGLGLRFPIAFSGTYTYTPASGGQPAYGELLPSLTAVDGSRNDYLSTGLPEAKAFDGKELVAQISANAGIGASLPGVGHHQISMEVGKDFTEGLPAPFRYGQFAPPVPGSKDLTFIKTFDDFDLIGGYGNYGVVGGQVFPAVEIGMHGEVLSLTLEDLYDNNRRYPLANGKPVRLKLNQDSQAASFAVKDPLYGASFAITPGLTARLFVDLALWGTHWDWTVTFPELSIHLPSGGVTFGCHEQTVCERRFRYTPMGAQSQFASDQIAFSKFFVDTHARKCQDDTCRSSIQKLATETLTKTLKMEAALSSSEISAVWTAARVAVDAIIEESRLNQDSIAWAEGLRASWVGRCVDSTCVEEIKALAGQVVVRAAQLRKTQPGTSNAVINGTAGKEFAPRFEAAINASVERKRRLEAARDGVKAKPAPTPPPTVVRPVIPPGGR